MRNFLLRFYFNGKKYRRDNGRRYCFNCVSYKPGGSGRRPLKTTDIRICEHCKKDFYPVTYFQGKRLWRRGRKYCFDCVPYEPSKNGEGSILKSRNTLDNKRQCRTCREYKELTDFSPTNKFGNLNSYCKSCAAKKKKTFSQRFKEQCVAYKGGKCMNCGYDKCIAALEFHHRNPLEKDFKISGNNKRFNKAVESELDKCDCLCSNCHKEIHYLKEKENGNTCRKN